MRLLLALFIAVLCLAQEPATRTVRATVPLDADLAQAFTLNQTQAQYLSAAREVIRLTACLRAGVKAEECGPFDPGGKPEVRLIPKKAEGTK